MSKPTKGHDGIPAGLTIDAAISWIRPRLSGKRFKHTEGVAKVALELAESVGEDRFLAELGAWLHDACKEIKDHELVRMAKSFGLQLHPLEEANGHLLHGPVAAETVRAELGVGNELVLDAIRQHTLGAEAMTNQSLILYLADCLEESRPKEFTKPIWHSLYGGKSGKDANICDLEAAMLTACDLSLQYLLNDRKIIHPKTVAVRNYYLKKTARS